MEQTTTILANACIGIGAILGAYLGNEYGGSQVIFSGGCLGATVGYFLGWPVAEYFEPIATWLLDDHTAWIIVPLAAVLIGILLSIGPAEQPCAAPADESAAAPEVCTIDPPEAPAY